MSLSRARGCAISENVNEQIKSDVIIKLTRRLLNRSLVARASSLVIIKRGGRREGHEGIVMAVPFSLLNIFQPDDDVEGG